MVAYKYKGYFIAHMGYHAWAVLMPDFTLLQSGFSVETRATDFVDGLTQE